MKLSCPWGRVSLLALTCDDTQSFQHGKLAQASGLVPGPSLCVQSFYRGFITDQLNCCPHGQMQVPAPSPPEPG